MHAPSAPIPSLSAMGSDYLAASVRTRWTRSTREKRSSEPTALARRPGALTAVDIRRSDDRPPHFHDVHCGDWTPRRTTLHDPTTKPKARPSTESSQVALRFPNLSRKSVRRPNREYAPDRLAVDASRQFICRVAPNISTEAAFRPRLNRDVSAHARAEPKNRTPLCGQWLQIRTSGSRRPENSSHFF